MTARPAAGWTVVDSVLRWRWPLSVLAVATVAFAARGDYPPDLLSFGERGAFVLHGHLSQVYSGSWNQPAHYS